MNEYNFTSNAEESQPNLRMVVDNTTNPNFVAPVNNVQPDLQVVVDNTKEKGVLLVADDAPIIRNIIKNAVQDEFSTIEAENGDEAISKLEQINYDVDGVFLDLVMPVSNGYAVLDTLKSQNIKIPVTVISGDDSEQTISTVCNNYGGHVNYISKPLGKPQIIAAAQRMKQSKPLYAQEDLASMQRVA